MVPASAGPGDIGYQGAHFSGTGTSATGAKPESKLWWNDGFWWAVMWDEPLGDNYIYKLNTSTHVWMNTGVEVDNRSGTRADVIWDGTKLFVASHPYANHAQASTAGSLLYRFSYNAATDTYTKDTGYPGTINNWRTESLVIAKDSTGRLWATWNQGTTIYVNRSLTNQASWGTPFALPNAEASGITDDDISSIVSFGGNSVGIMWSDQTRAKFHFATHRDGTALTTWVKETALSGPLSADDHISLKSDSAGRVFAAVKSANTVTLGDNWLLVRAATGIWSKTLVSEARERWTRPIVVLDSAHGIAHVFATAPETGGTIYHKAAEINNLAFEPGVGEPVLRDADSPDINDVTSTKQNVTTAMGLVIQASDDTINYYWHNELPAASLPLRANLSGTPTTGGVPLAVAFTDLSSGNPVSWSWNFGDGSSSTLENPSHTYTAPGSYTVTLTSTNATGQQSQRTMTDYILVQPLAASFTGTPTLGAAPLPVQFTDTSTGDPVGWSWTFGDGGTSTLRNPSHTYNAPGTYNVTLRVTGKNAATNTTTQTGYVTALPLTAEFGATPTTGPAPLAVQFTDTSFGKPTTWTWAFGDGGTSNLPNPSHTYSAPGKYTVSLTVTDAAGARSTKTRTDLVEALPLAANFAVDKIFGSVPLTVNFTDTSVGTATTWAWNFGDGTTASVKSPSHTYVVPGTYTVTLTVSDASGATSTKTQPDLITVSPDAAFGSSADTYVDSSQPTRTNGSAGSLRVRSGEVSPPHYVSYLRFGVTGLGARVTAAKLRLRVTDAALDGGAVYLVNDNTWTESAVNWSNAPTITGAPLATIGGVDVGNVIEVLLPRSLFAAGNGTYNFAIKSTTSGGAAWYSSREGVEAPELILRVTPLPLNADFGADETGGGAPLTVNFLDASDGEPTTWTWDFGDGTTSSQPNPTHTYTDLGTHNVTLTITDAKGGTSTRTIENFITVEALDAEFRATPASGPAPLATTFLDLSRGSPTAWAWDFGDGTTSTLRNPSHTYSTPGTYTVTLMVTDRHGATNTEARTGGVTAFPLTADFTALPTFGSTPVTVVFNETTIGYPTTWTWNFGDGIISTDRNPTHTYTSAGVYTVSLTVTDAAGATNTKTRANFVTVSADTVFAPTADSYVDSSNPTKNSGAAGSVRVRNGTTAPPTYVSYLKFVVSGLTDPVDSATLRLYVTDSSSDGGQLFTADNGWTETGLNWSNAPAVGTTPLASLGVVDLNTWVEIPLPGSLFAAGNGVYTLAIKSNNPSGGAAWYSSREGTAAPQLILR